MPNVEDIAQQVSRLPEPLQQEVLDFVEFLQSKQSIQHQQLGKGSLLELRGGLEDSTTFIGDEVEIQERMRDEWVSRVG